MDGCRGQHADEHAGREDERPYQNSKNVGFPLGQSMVSSVRVDGVKKPCVEAFLGEVELYMGVCKKRSWAVLARQR